MLDKLRAERLQNNARLDYTIGGPVQATVVSTLEVERETKIMQGDRTLHVALQKMRYEQSFTSREGLVKAHFNHSKQEIKP